jgi:hypothetical protein
LSLQTMESPSMIHGNLSVDCHHAAFIQNNDVIAVALDQAGQRCLSARPRCGVDRLDHRSRRA